VQRQAILALGKIGSRSVLLDLMMRAGQVNPWVDRAILHVCAALPKHEREAFYKSQLKPGTWTVENALRNAVIAAGQVQAPPPGGSGL
jgi:hypothetical protein